MQRKIFAFLAPLLLLAPACGPKTDAPGDVAAIKAMEEAYAQAVNAGDAASLAALYAEDAIRMVPNMPAVKGREAIRALYRNEFALFTDTETNPVEDIKVIGDLAVVRGTYTTKAVPKIAGPAAIDDTGKWIAVSRRQADGSWKYVCDASSTDLPPARVLYPGGAEEQAILELERNWSAALKNQDAAALEPILAETFSENRGGVLTRKKEILAGMKAARNKLDSVEAAELRVLVFGEFGVVNSRGVVKETVGGKEVVEAYRFIDTFQKQNGTWKAVSAFLVPEQ